MKTDTAHRAWDLRWSTAEGRANWLVPDGDVEDLARELAETRTGLKALDLGCGVGRHALLFAQLGFETTAVDLAEAGIEEVRRNANQEELAIETLVAPMSDLPFDDGTFDYVLSFNVIYHGDPDVVAKTIAEIGRVLKPGGIFQGTMLSKRNAGFGLGTEVAPDTFVRPASAGDAEDDSDKVHPHFYINAAGLLRLLDGFEITCLRDVAQKPGAWHWQFAAEKHG